MSEQTILYLLIGIVTFEFVLDRFLDYLNRKSSRKPIPEELKGIYDEEQYQKSQSYNAEVGRFSLLVSSVSFLLLVAALYFGWFGWLDDWIRTVSPLDMVSTLIFFGVLYMVSDVIGIPFSLYQTFKIEEKYGFNKMTVKTFVLDKVKGYILAILFGGLLLAILVYLVNAIGGNFWIYFWGVVVAFLLFANLLYTTLVLPLFNKLTPLKEGELYDAIKAYSEKVSFPLKNIFIMDGSKRSAKGNAFFSGLGKQKKVVLFDTLVEKHSVEELTGVFAHEVGHYKKKHIIYGLLFSILLTGFMLYLLSLIIYNAEVSWALGGQTSALHLNMLAFGILYSPVSTLLGIIGNIISRKNEFEADAYARETFGSEPLVAALKKMTSDHLSNLTPHPAYVFVNYSHPPLQERVRALSK